MDRIRILRSAIGWAGRHAVSLLVAVAALGVAAEFGPALAQSADLLLARALHIDGDVSTGATDRAVVIQGDDGVNYRTVSTDASGDLQVDVLSSVGAGSMTDDAAFTPGTSTITAVGGLFDDVSPDSVNEGDGGAFRMSARREAYMQIRDAAGNERGLAIDGSGFLGIGTFPDNEPVDVAQIGGNAITAGAGAVAAGTPRMTLASDDPAVVDLAAIEVLETSIEGDTTAIQTAVQVMDDWDETNRAAVNVIAGQAGIAAGTGVDGATVPRVTLATDVGLPAGDADIGNVDLEFAGTAASVNAGNVDATTQRVVLATDQAVVEVQPDQVVPQVPATVACDTTGAVAFTANAADVRLEMWNSGTVDACVRMGATTGADIGTTTSCSFILGAFAGSGTTDVYVTPAGMRVGSETFACDVSAGTANIVVTAWRTQ